MKRASGPTWFARLVRKAITSCRVSRSIASIFSGFDERLRVLVDGVGERGRSLLRRLAERDLSVERMALDVQPDAEASLRCPDRGHLRA